MDCVHRHLPVLVRAGNAGPRSFLFLLSATKDRRPLERTLDLFQIVREAADLLVEPADVAVPPRERRADVHEPSPQAPFPKPQGDDLDLVTRIGP